MSTAQQQDEVFERIHESAAALLEERGIDGIQVREVAERANTCLLYTSDAADDSALV